MDSRSMRSATWDVSEQLNVRMQILDVYQAFDKAKYEELLGETMTYLELFLNNGVLFNQIRNKVHPLDYMMHIVRNGVFLAQEDTVAQEAEFKKVEKVAGLMQKYSPDLLQKYFSAPK